MRGWAADRHPSGGGAPTGRCGAGQGQADSFLATGLGELLDERAVRCLIVTGFATEYCVDSTTAAHIRVDDARTTNSAPRS
ncbi:isochorismatase family protein [Streptomyces sp. NPDC008150]|uniref:isochorismatase family protein n=1 Tax=Streptomyces sp. NPDC008150 TaxID=3364816 RepID=UPI0036E326B7